LDTTKPGVSGEAYHNNFGTDTHADGKNTIFQFARQLINLRRSSVAMRQGSYSMAITFSKNDGSAGFDSHADRAVRITMDGSAVGDSDYALFVNNWTGTVTFTVPPADAGKHWVRIIDTDAWAEPNDNFWTTASATTITGTYDAHPWSIVVLKAVN